MDAAQLIDAATPEPVLVIGSLPPQGRDLDLLVRPRAALSLSETLAANGFHCVEGTWARFAGCDAEVVELIPAQEMSVDADPLAKLFSEAVPVEGLASVMRPSSHHSLLLVARRAAREGRLKPTQRARAEEADDEAWQRARALAPSWHAESALSDLQQALRGSTPKTWAFRLALGRARRYRPGAVIAISGLDGSGKSTQIEGLTRSLSSLGYRTVTVWTSFGANPSFARLAARARALIGKGQSREGSHPPPAGEDEDRLTVLRERLPGLRLAAVTLGAWLNAWWQARATWPHLLQGRIVICDRYTLDSIVQMRYRFGIDRRFTAQIGLIKLLSPRPLRSILIDVDPATAHGRNGEYTLSQVELRARLYREEASRHGAISVDGELPKDELCAQLALEVWKALGAAQ